MAESTSRISEFKAVKKIFDNVASLVVCSSCHIVPRSTPIYQTEKGLVLCTECKPKSNLTGIYQSFLMENLLMDLPISCKYHKNKCPIVQEKKNISYHEEDCEFRDVLCPYQSCEERIGANLIQEHLLKTHKLDDIFVCFCHP